MWRVTPLKNGSGFTIETQLDVESITDQTGCTSFVACDRDSFLGLIREAFPYLTSVELSELQHDAWSEMWEREKLISNLNNKKGE